MAKADLTIRPAGAADAQAIWAILEPVIRAGETYALPREMEEADALAYWLAPGHEVFVAEAAGAVLGTYYMRPNQPGGGSHVANCGYMVAGQAQGRGIARAMASHSLGHARSRGYGAMQYNFVIATNERAIRLWQALGFGIVGRVPRAFQHPQQGFVDALVMHREL
jgi:ribosomal protein S18 acetylase RimI-like enzyme